MALDLIFIMSHSPLCLRSKTEMKWNVKHLMKSHSCLLGIHQSPFPHSFSRGEDLAASPSDINKQKMDVFSFSRPLADGVPQLSPSAISFPVGTWSCSTQGPLHPSYTGCPSLPGPCLLPSYCCQAIKGHVIAALVWEDTERFLLIDSIFTICWQPEHWVWPEALDAGLYFSFFMVLNWNDCTL